MTDQAHRTFKNELYGQFARIGKALASPHRIELVELLAQGERTVDALAEEAALSTANASQHLQVLREAGLVESNRQGLFVRYRLSDPSVFELTRLVRAVAEKQLGDLERLVRRHFGDRSGPQPVTMEELLRRAHAGDTIIIDTRPPLEFAAGHIAGAISIPAGELQKNLRKLPRNKRYVAYCRGPYCVYADRAVEILRTSGREACRLLDGFPEWKAAGLPVASGATQARTTGRAPSKR